MTMIRPRSDVVYGIFRGLPSDDVSVEEAEEFHIFHNVIKNQFDYDKLLIQSNLWTSWKDIHT